MNVDVEGKISRISPMINYQKLRTQLESLPKTEWERFVSNMIESDTSLEDEIEGRIMGVFVNEIAIYDNIINAAVYYTVDVGTEYSEIGEYQDEDGNSYDQKETEYEFNVTISPEGTTWERV